ncbi:hypothetical protein LA6_002447 [Marinibacterium anthonyi]|nr:hypothetical protein LA6_002447 [Marinibacterium anthonyi]
MANTPHGMSRYNIFLKECLHNCDITAEPLPQVFGYLGKKNPITGNLSRAAIVAAFDKLVDDMKTNVVLDGPAEAGQTFFGQFIDHDITLDATSAIGTHTDPATIRNVRTPNLDLDCVYGDGPDATPHLFSPDHDGFLLFGREENPNDLARNCKGRALIGDPRNDENVLVSQIQGCFIKLHNILMAKVATQPEVTDAVTHCAMDGTRSEVWADMIPEDLKGFEMVRRFIRLHYQWLVLNDFLPSFVDQACIDAALAHDPFGSCAPIMPAEFSVAAYRFGHATVQAKYDINAAKMGVGLFAMHGFGWRSSDWDMEMSRFFGPGAQKALPVGTKMAKDLFELPANIVNKPLMWGDLEIDIPKARKLALRNILRDRTAILLPSGQQLARKLGIPELAAPPQLADAHITKTPLWFYCLQEAQDSGKKKLTGVGGTIVASVFARLLKLDPESMYHLHGFTPWPGFGPNFSMAALTKWVDDNYHAVDPFAKDLFCGPPQPQP